MKILIIQGGFGAGGAEKIVSILAAHRAERGDEVHVAGLTMPPSGSYFPFPDEVTLHVAQAGGGQLDRLRHIRSVIQQVAPDVIISFLTKINVLTLIATLDRATPVIISERNNPRAQTANPVWRHAQNLLARRARAVVMQTQRASEDLPRAIQRKARIIANPCALPTGAREHLGTGSSNLVAVGRLDHQKGFDLLLDAMPQILAGNPGARLTIYGEGPARKALEAQRDRLQLGDVVSMPGSSAAPGEWMDNADILVFSSRYEGFPNVLAEATVTGLPLVSFDCPYGPRELIRPEENGLLVPPEDVDGLAQAVLRLSSSPELLQKMRDADLESRVWLAPDNILAEWDETIDDVA